MNKCEELQKLLDLLDEKILHLRMAKVTQTDALALFKLEKDIDNAQAEQDRIKQEIENQNISDASCNLYQALLKLGYREQVLSFKKFLRVQSIATFLLHGSPDYGQRWLLNRLITQHIRYGTTGKLVRVELDRIARKRDISALWRELGGRVGLLGKQHQPSEIVERVYEWWKTQNVILVFHDVDCMPQEYLQELIQEFWLPLASLAREVTYKYQLLMFLVDYEGCIGTQNTLFVEKLEPTWEPKIPIKLPSITQFCVKRSSPKVSHFK
ncbi:hypothetical protein IQ247_04190 [Plectonema cf. radiosum LEGE 06105]|uniref:Inactive STAND domain-containing protein n=1 Tax=Plectonema cf. radiosum LEGE 06105 TaxID=945769 RepID=A0A8J7JYT3_9CYAN|nr:hypothetical protein [Plectonema radiosum]MBE9211927.1 hypothetical protein [Plectonema cf. radiosum LEGE 06105]